MGEEREGGGTFVVVVVGVVFIWIINLNDPTTITEVNVAKINKINYALYY